MLTQYKRSWVLLSSFAACAGLAATPAFAVEPQAWLRRASGGDAHYLSSTQDRASDFRECLGCVGKNAEVLAEVDQQPAENAQSMYVIKLLKGSSQFRVRAQAAISLGLMQNTLGAREALTAALQDEHPAVRAAAAISLGRIGDANHISALRMLAGDPEGPVRHAARASIARIQTATDESPAVLESEATVALSAATSPKRL